MAMARPPKRDKGNKKNGMRNPRSRSAPFLYDGEWNGVESKSPKVSFNYSSKDFPPLGLTDPDPEPELNFTKSGLSKMNSVGPVLAMTPEAPPTPTMSEAGGGGSRGSACGQSMTPTAPPPPMLRPKEKTVFRTNGVVEKLPASAITDQYGLAGFIVGQLQQFTNHGPLPDQIAGEVFRESGVVGMGPLMGKMKLKLEYTKSCFNKPTVPAVVSEESPQPIPEFNVAPHVSKGMFGAGAGNDPDMAIKNSWYLKARMFNEDMLFYLFYTFTQDILQVIAAQHLFNKGWRYHIPGQVWIKPLQGLIYIKEFGGSIEKGAYKVFDCKMWEVAEKNLCINMADIEDSPCTINPALASVM